MSRRPLLNPTEVARLAALSRHYHAQYPDIVRAVVQELGHHADPVHQAEVAERFGMDPDRLAHLRADRVRAVYDEYIHRSGLSGAPHVYVQVLHDIAVGRLAKGGQLPPRTRFTALYHCDKRTHQQVVARLLAAGVVDRPGGKGGPLRIL